ncbi:sodium-dependent dicarboxylate transporter 2/3/5 [Rhodococcus wratislaviensis]|uniref:Sodium-dependent dicarboxylate transporter SdcS n=1 Tax=Rhodococcus wratislaviensis TaxID=44752 RepID=A0AB38FQ60_RHOWR|nr:DASS family sodium-coupled anion symporter [Rhodococcus wratislaviensis]REE71429.1 sodium-dependent dicarboxylate transporter 2/3/5 [Rhodococcus wratislaviensis]SPZ43237.1 sodium symporter ABC transporter [Rhodococcus wratislaviensis]
MTVPTRVPNTTGNKVPPTVDKERLPSRTRTQAIGLLVGGIGFVALLVIPTGLSGPQQRLAAILILAVAFWITEALPLAVTSLLAIGLAATLGIADSPDGGNGSDLVFSSFSSSVIFLLIGGFLFAKAINVHGLDARFALRVLTLPGVAKSSYRVIVAFGFIALVISAFVSNSATATMLLPIGLGLIRTLNPIMSPGDTDSSAPRQTRFATALMLMIAYAAAVGGMLTPIGSPANLVGIGYIEKLTGSSIGFLQWTAATAPIVAIMFVILCVVIISMNRPECRALPDLDYLRHERAQLGRLSTGERSTLFAFCLVCAGWLTPSVVSLTFGVDSSIATFVAGHLDDGAVAVIAATLLFVLPGSKTGARVLNWEQAVRIDWGVIVLVGAGIVLGGLLSSTGLADLVGETLSQNLGFPSLFVITLFAVAMAILLSETTSNTAAVAIVVPIVVPIAMAAGINPVIPAVASVFGGSFGFMLPIAQIPNAIVYGSGFVPIKRMLRTGSVFDLVGCILIAIGVVLWLPHLGLG